eukprot:CAMPEP_0113516040 /NCGR_PEP_ID=MMETSP0014_2-20120614/41319_1 /TAXON_ID=2857 /ORGANISM="Nitzschia sp." /LENGTH=1114 /DNA_ID=CAMNT_0000412755 /DNA_START=492 /DNA_END=3836 /DNA_ORIENTATION=- /assembly_acc=CAM_ASM_000159
MVRFHAAAVSLLMISSCVLLTMNYSPVYSFQQSSDRQRRRYASTIRSSADIGRILHSSSSSSVAAASSDNGGNSNSNGPTTDALMMGEAFLSSATNAAVDSIISNLTPDDSPDLDEQQILRRQQLLRSRSIAGGQQTYKVTLPLRSSSTSSSVTTAAADASRVTEQATGASVLDMGIRLCQINRGRNMNDKEQLDLDTLEYTSSSSSSSSSSPSSSAAAEVMDVSSLQRRIDGEFQGIVVWSVQEGSAGWMAGVRPGDILTTSSATLGEQLWPKSTLDGVRSAMQSRKAVAGSIQFEFQRLADVEDNQFELSLTRPIGLELRETADGYVEVVGFTEKASNLVKYGVQIGDRILAVESSIGGRLWPVSTVEGVISATTARLPGQQVTFRFERRSSTISIDTKTSAPTAAAAAASSGNVTESDDFRFSVASSADYAPSVATHSQKIPDFELLKKCRAVLKRYTTDEKYINKFELPAVVADKVMQTIASSEAQMDPVTLSMVQTAYLSSNQPQKAIDAFEAAVGLKGDGSNAIVVTSDGPIFGTDDKRIIPTLAALDLFTAGSLMNALKMKGDIVSVQRVVQALEGKTGEIIGGLEVADWPGTQPGGPLHPDTQCYNIVMSALAEQGTEESLQEARDLFESLSNPGRKEVPVNGEGNSAPRKDVVSYNTMIKALTDFGAHEAAIDVFYQMKTFGIQPDKLSYTSLAKAVMMNDNIEELLYDMKERGVAPDVIFFNTVIKDLCGQKKLSAARKIVTLMESSGVSPNSLTYGYLMRGLMDAGKPSAALTLFESACADSRTAGLTENVYMYTSAVTAAASIGDYTRALDYISRMKTVGVKPNLKTLTALLGACLSAGKPELAVGIFNSIPDPDFYALGQGFLAMAQAGEGDEVLRLLSEKGAKASRLRGKRLMAVYESLLSYAIDNENFDLARRTISNLMQKGNIPSKGIYRTIFESMNLLPKSGLVSKISFPEDGVVRRKGLDAVDMEKYKFLTFIVDTLSARNLPCEAALYSAILSFGNHLGGLPRKISALMIAAKVHAGDFGSNRLIHDEQCEDECVVGGWEDLVVSYDEIRNQLVDPSSLPRLHIRVSKKDVPRVLKAEKNLSYSTILSPRRRKEV